MTTQTQPQTAQDALQQVDLGATPTSEQLRELYRQVTPAVPASLQDTLEQVELTGRRAAPLPLLDAWLAQQVGLTLPEGRIPAFYLEQPLSDTGDTTSLTLRPVEYAGLATDLIVSWGDGWSVLPLDQAEVTALPGLNRPPLAEVKLDAGQGQVQAGTALNLGDVQRLARLGLTARALGAASRALDLALEYAKTRQQFGQLIGKFQAIQHKLATQATAATAVRELLGRAAQAYDAGQPGWTFHADAAFAYASPALRQLVLEAHHVLAAQGYHEEHEAPRHFRRVQADLTRLGGVRAAREGLADYLLTGGDEPADQYVGPRPKGQSRSLPVYSLGEQADAFRQEVRGWLAQHWPEERRLANRRLPVPEAQLDRTYSRAVGEAGFVSLAWPKEVGGQGRGMYERYAYEEETGYHETPSWGHAAGGSLVGPALLQFGRPEQQAEWLPRLQRGEVMFSLGYTEPQAGSDLASLTTSAVLDGDEWVINGVKIWNGMAHKADYQLLAVRTDPDVPKHKGISLLLVPLTTPGITVRPLPMMNGIVTGEVTYDNVRVPKGALLGQVNQGWTVLGVALAEERILMGAQVARLRSYFDRFTADLVARSLHHDPVVRETVGELAAEVEAARALGLHSLDVSARGENPMPAAAMSKVFSGELEEKFALRAQDLLGTDATLAAGVEGSAVDGGIEFMTRQGIMDVVGGGTAEVQRNLIAQLGLGLPR